MMAGSRQRGDGMTDPSTLGFVPSRILVPIDFSPSSLTALGTAADLASHFHASLVLAHVVPEFVTSTVPDFFPESKFLDHARKAAEGRFGAYQMELSGKGIDVSYCIEQGNDVAGHILRVIERERIDFLVISTHGLTGWHPLVFGSTAEKIVKMAQCPLLLLRSARPDTEQGEAAQ
jgi:nucleotide-binding universal stress UspA family protein